jgi:hypothetical protein
MKDEVTTATKKGEGSLPEKKQPQPPPTSKTTTPRKGLKDRGTPALLSKYSTTFARPTTPPPPPPEIGSSAGTTRHRHASPSRRNTTTKATARAVVPPPVIPTRAHHSPVRVQIPRSGYIRTREDFGLRDESPSPPFRPTESDGPGTPAEVPHPGDCGCFYCRPDGQRLGGEWGCEHLPALSESEDEDEDESGDEEDEDDVVVVVVCGQEFVVGGRKGGREGRESAKGQLGGRKVAEPGHLRRRLEDVPRGAKGEVVEEWLDSGREAKGGPREGGERWSAAPPLPPPSPTKSAATKATQTSPTISGRAQDLTSAALSRRPSRRPSLPEASLLPSVQGSILSLSDFEAAEAQLPPADQSQPQTPVVKPTRSPSIQDSLLSVSDLQAVKGESAPRARSRSSPPPPKNPSPAAKCVVSGSEQDSAPAPPVHKRTPPPPRTRALSPIPPKNPPSPTECVGGSEKDSASATTVHQRTVPPRSQPTSLPIPAGRPLPSLCLATMKATRPPSRSGSIAKNSPNREAPGEQSSPRTTWMSPGPSKNASLAVADSPRGRPQESSLERELRAMRQSLEALRIEMDQVIKQGRPGREVEGTQGVRSVSEVEPAMAGRESGPESPTIASQTPSQAAIGEETQGRSALCFAFISALDNLWNEMHPDT